MEKKVVTVIGKVCSGKDTYTRNHFENYVKIDVGDIVRNLTETESRTHNSQLSESIINVLINAIGLVKYTKNEGVVISGIRQLSILDAVKIKSTFDNMKFEIVFLDAPNPILKGRYDKRAAKKDSQNSFEDVVKLDGLLGLDDLIEYLSGHNSEVIKIANYEQHEIDALQKI